MEGCPNPDLGIYMDMAFVAGNNGKGGGKTLAPSFLLDGKERIEYL